ncbi:MAG: STAS domain-containing protein [Mycobacterium sp.]
MSNQAQLSNHIQAALDHTQCTVVEHWSNNTVILGCAGVLDMVTAPELERRIAIALEKRPTSLIVDLTHVDFLASHGMNVLVTAHRQCSAGTEFAVVADGHVTRRPMQLIGLTDILTMHATLDDALGKVAA